MLTSYNDKSHAFSTTTLIFSVTRQKLAVLLGSVLSIPEAGGFKHKGKRDIVNA